MSETAPSIIASCSSVPIELRGDKRPFYFRTGTHDEGIINVIFNQQDYSLDRLARKPDLMRYVSEAVAKNRPPLVVDGGANIGASALYFCSLDPTLRVVAIEPDFDNYEILKENSKGRPIDPMRAALGATSGRAEVFDPGHGTVGYRTRRLEEGATQPSVPCVTINGIYAAHPGWTPFIVKIDIEGAEKELFSAHTEWVEHTPLIIIELHDWMLPKAGTALPFLKCITQYDRDFVHIGENIFSISNTI